MEQVNADFGGYRAFCNKSMKFGTNMPLVVLFQKKVHATIKIQGGGFFPRWPPDQTFSHERGLAMSSHILSISWPAFDFEIISLQEHVCKISTFHYHSYCACMQSLNIRFHLAAILEKISNLAFFVLASLFCLKL